VSVFLAVDVDQATREAVAALIDEWSARFRATWLTAQKLHITVAFLGQLTASERRRVTQRVAPIAHATAPFSLELAGAGVFETRRAPMVLWLGVQGDLSCVSSFRQRCAQALQLPDDRPWVPHVTLARVHTPSPETGAALRAFEKVRGLRFGVSHLTLYESHEGAYTALATIPLGAQKPGGR
jgi:RNA 2',3'-cyclic 3'-phosphodiesterase